MLEFDYIGCANRCKNRFPLNKLSLTRRSRALLLGEAGLVCRNVQLLLENAAAGCHTRRGYGTYRIGIRPVPSTETDLRLLPLGNAGRTLGPTSLGVAL